MVVKKKGKKVGTKREIKKNKQPNKQPNKQLNKLKKISLSKEKIKQFKSEFKIKTFFIIFVVIIFFILAFLFTDQLKSLIQNFILNFGLLGVFIVAFLSDILMQPIGPDVPIFAAVVYGISLWPTILVAIAATVLATILSYFLGVKFGSDGFLRFYGQKQYDNLKRKYDKYSLIVPLAALTPVPYVPICWLSGIFRMKKGKFFLYALIPRALRLIAVGLFATLFV